MTHAGLPFLHNANLHRLIVVVFSCNKDMENHITQMAEGEEPSA